MSELQWWKQTAIYHIYPRSFRDSNNDGFGDLKGIIQKLPYLKELGIGAIWMGPVFRSPQVDNGYDIADYRDIDPMFGALADMDRLIETAHGLGIRVLLDLVFNHTSDQHPWFESSVSDPTGPYGDYYIWRDPQPDGSPPNNWRSVFTGSAWQWVPERSQYYLHLFAGEQPDLNWENPAVRRELVAIANFWIDRGVDGFRMDVINFISKHPDYPSLAEGAQAGGAGAATGVYIDGPKVLLYLQEFRANLISSDEIVLVGETPGVGLETAAEYTKPENRALDMVLLFDHVSVDHGPGGRWDPRPWKPSELAAILDAEQQALSAPAWPSIYMSNHDQPRVVSRYGDDQQFRYESATALATLFYLQRGTPVIYQGDEIAMANYPIASPEDIVDVESRNGYLELVERWGVPPEEALDRVKRNARDNSRTPMQWTPATYAGFMDATAAKPWYPVNPDYQQWNVDAQTDGAFAWRHQAIAQQGGAIGGGHGADAQQGGTIGAGESPSSVWFYYRRLLELRRATPAFLSGSCELISSESDDPIIAYRRVVPADASSDTVAGDAGQSDRRTSSSALVLVNMSSDSQPIPEALNRELQAFLQIESSALALSNYAQVELKGDGGTDGDVTERDGGAIIGRTIVGSALRPWEAIVLIA